MKNLVTIILQIALIASCVQASYKNPSAQNAMTENKSNLVPQQSNTISDSLKCSTWECLEKNKNKEAVVEGIFQKYTPNENGKGANHLFWDWEIMLSDSIKVPIAITDKKVDYNYFQGKKVFIKGTIFYGIIIGSSDNQNATGFRIDPVEIIEIKKGAK